MRHRDVCLAAVVAVAGCGRDRGDSSPTLPATRLSIASAPTDVREGQAAVFSIVAVDTSGASAAFDGTIEVLSNGPVSPSSVLMADGEATATLTLQLGGDGFVRFTTLGLSSAQQYVLVRPPMPARAAGPDLFGSVLAEGTGWDDAGAWSPAAVLAGSEVRLYYASSSGSAVANIGLATSTDGLIFAKVASPVVGPSVSASACHADGADHPDVTGGAGAWVMLYQGRVSGGSRLCRATSADGLTWTPAPGGGPDGSVLTLSTSADVIDNVAIHGPAVVVMPDSTLAMLYGAEGSGEFYDIASSPDDIGALGGAVSSDGIVWSKSYGPMLGGAVEFGVAQFPPFTPEWQLYSVLDPAIERAGTVFHVWASGFGYEDVWRIGRFSGTDLFDLGPHVDGDFDTGEVLGPGPAGNFDDAGALQPSLLTDASGGRRVFYTGIHAADGTRRIGVASY